MAAVIDLFSRRVVGWSMSASMTAQLVADALLMAIWRRGKPDALMHHSDRGSQYASEQFQRLMADSGIVCSMSRSGNVWDNAAMESFFSSLKTERIERKTYRSRNEARADVFDYIERFYNATRRHSTIGYLSPVEFERKVGSLTGCPSNRQQLNLVSFPYRCNSPRKRRTFVLIGAPLAQGPKPTFVLLHLNISAMIGRCSNSHVSKAVEWSTSRALTDHLARMDFSEMISDGRESTALLTEREREVLILLRQGMTNKEIAARLSRSPNTVKIHVSHILEKLNVRSRTEAALTSFNFGKYRRSHV